MGKTYAIRNLPFALRSAPERSTPVTPRYCPHSPNYVHTARTHLDSVSNVTFVGWFDADTEEPVCQPANRVKWLHLYHADRTLWRHVEWIARSQEDRPAVAKFLTVPLQDLAPQHRQDIKQFVLRNGRTTRAFCRVLYGLVTARLADDRKWRDTRPCVVRAREDETAMEVLREFRETGVDPALSKFAG